MAIPAGVILIWTGTNASIPTGWTRETSLDDKYPKAWGAQNPNVTGGSNTHTHTGSHTHTLSSHTHTFSLNTYDPGSRNGVDVSSSENGSGAHSHGSATTSGISGGSLISNGSWQSVNQEPPYYSVIFIKPSITVSPLSIGICAYYSGASSPPTWNFCDGNNSTPDLRNKYLKGASAGADAGTTGGGTSHSHTITHNHTANTHTHTGTSPIMTGSYSRYNASNATSFALKGHTHTITFANATDSIANYTNTTAGSTDTVEPAYKKIGVIKSSVGSIKKGIIGLWLGSIASIPNGWIICDGNNDTLDLRDKFIKISNTLAENNNTGGSNTHTHSSISHTHSASGTHTHSGTSDVANSGVYQADGYNTGALVVTAHTHTATIGTATATYSTDNITADTVSNEPAYRTVAYIQLNKLDLGGAMLMSKLM